MFHFIELLFIFCSKYVFCNKFYRLGVYYLLFLMQGESDIAQVTQNGTLYLVSKAQKENDSGIMFNDRTFFLLPEKHIGYLSDSKVQDYHKLPLQKPKSIIPISQLRNMVVNDRGLLIKFVFVDNEMRVEKEWTLRFANSLLARKWYDKLQREKILDTARKSQVKSALKSEVRSKEPSPSRNEGRIQSQRKSLQISRSESFTYSAAPKEPPEKNQIGVETSFRIEEQQPKKQPIQKQQIGTVMGKSFSQLTFKGEKEKGIQIGTAMSVKAPSQKRSQSPKIQHRQYGTAMSVRSLSPPKTVKTAKEQQKLSQKWIAETEKKQAQNKNASIYAQNHQAQSQASFVEPRINKSVYSQPANRKLEPMNFSKKKFKEDDKFNEQIVSKKIDQPKPKVQNSPPKIHKQQQKKQPIKQVKKEQQKPVQPISRVRKSQNLSKSQIMSKPQVKPSINYSIYQIKGKDQIQIPPKSQLSSSKGQISRDPVQSVKANLLEEKKQKEVVPFQPPKVEQKRQNEQKIVPLKLVSAAEVRPSPQNSSNMRFSIPQQAIQNENDLDTSDKMILKELQSQASKNQRNEEHNATSYDKPWTYLYLSEDDLMFDAFQGYCSELFQEIIEDMRLPVHERSYRQKASKNGIVYYQIKDVQVKISLIDIKESKLQKPKQNVQKICDKSGVKELQNQFKNYCLLYELLQSDSKLKVPLVCLCQNNGFIALFKILSFIIEKPIKMREIEGRIEELAKRSKINQDFYKNHNKNIIKLDQNYYNRLKQKQTQRVDFQCYFLQQINEYLPEDTYLQNSFEKSQHLIRSQLIKRYKEEERQTKGKLISKLKVNSKPLSQKLSANIHSAITETCQQIDSLRTFFYNSKDLSNFLHEKGMSMRYLGQIYQSLRTAFPRRVIMSEMAARSCKSLFRKTIQDIFLEDEEASYKSLIMKACDFLNCVLGGSFETAALWKLLASHSKAYFGVGIDFQMIDKGYFFVSLVDSCKLRVDWGKISTENIFGPTAIFNQSNLITINASQKIYSPHHNKFYKKFRQILDSDPSQQKLEQLLGILHQIPQKYATSLQLKRYLSLYISPYKQSDSRLSEVRLYSGSQPQPSRAFFEMMMAEIKWYLKYKDRQNYIAKCDEFITNATKYYGDFHPIFSELYDIFSSYHLGNNEIEDSITFAKSSLVNIFKVCGTNHEKTSEAYYNLALCFLKANKKEEAFTNIKKSKSIFENSGKTDHPSYAIILLKMGLVFLNQDQPKDCLSCTTAALGILEKSPISEFEDEMVDCFEMMTRCYEILQEKGKIRTIGKRCEDELKGVSAPHNLQKMLKIIIYPIFSEINSSTASNYLDIISLTPTPNQTNAYDIAFDRLRLRIEEESLLKNMGDYMDNMVSIQNYMRQNEVLGTWSNFKEIYPRQTINDFVALTEELLAFLGEGFIAGSLRESL